MDQASPVFAALGDPTRLALVARLCHDGPLSIAHLASGARITRQAISRHLETLAGAGVLRGTRAGRELIYEIETGRIEKAGRCLADISAQWDAVLDRLRAYVEADPSR